MNRIKELRTSLGLSQTAFANLLHVHQTAVSQWETGKTIPDFGTAIRISEKFHISLDALFINQENNRNENRLKIPAFGNRVVGMPCPDREEVLDYKKTFKKNSSQGRFFGMKITGDSMEPRICKGDIIIVRQQNDIDSGDIAIVLINGSVKTCKRVLKYKDGLSLIPLNPAYPPKFYTWAQVKEIPITIYGKAVGLRGKL